MSNVVPLPGLVKSAPGGRPLGLFAINLDRSPDRWAEIERGFGGLAWPLHRVAGIDARQNPDEVLAVRGLEMRHPPFAVGWNARRNRLFMVTEEACFVGHVLAWRVFLASDFEHAIILEDDAVPQDGFEGAVEELLAQDLGAAIVKLEGIYRPGGRKVLPLGKVGDRLLVRSLRPVSGAAGYLITRSAAERLLERTGSALVPADDFLWSPAWHGLKVLDVAPWVVMQSGAESVIATSRDAKKTRRANLPGRSVLMALKRMQERLALLWSACDGRPWRLMNATMAQWAPEDYNKVNSKAVAAEDRRSSNG
ncbi:glycosyltransferase family 25 protein [Rhizobium helianthi]|uniref:Glycosyltransferase family 25 protein n=1 Tax=Rhizobium helianthi TaxID=1132695 RepID=A0ABW4M701_9HYPH